MLSRSTMLLAALALAACERGSPGNREEPAPDAAGNGDSAASDSAGPSFDCARARGQVQQLICSNADLAAIDREADRLFRLAGGDPRVDPSIQWRLADGQQAWAASRDDCWKSDELEQCVRDSYARRIADLRSVSEAARGSQGGISIGPVAFECHGWDGRLLATFVNSEPGLAYLDWLGLPAGSGPSFGRDGLTLAQAASASGARYAGRVDGEAWELWTKGNEATITRPGGQSVTCTTVSTN